MPHGSPCSLHEPPRDRPKPPRTLHRATRSARTPTRASHEPRHGPHEPAHDAHAHRRVRTTLRGPARACAESAMVVAVGTLALATTRTGHHAAAGGQTRVRAGFAQLRELPRDRRVLRRTTHTSAPNDHTHGAVSRCPGALTAHAPTLGVSRSAASALPDPNDGSAPASAKPAPLPPLALPSPPLPPLALKLPPTPPERTPVPAPPGSPSDHAPCPPTPCRLSDEHTPD